MWHNHTSIGGNGGNMNAEHYIQKVRNLFDEFGHLDVDRACGYFHDDGYIQMMMKEPYAGMAEIRNMFSLGQLSGVNSSG